MQHVLYIECMPLVLNKGRGDGVCLYLWRHKEVYGAILSQEDWNKLAKFWSSTKWQRDTVQAEWSHTCCVWKVPTLSGILFSLWQSLTASATTAVSRRSEEASEAGKAWRIYWWGNSEAGYWILHIHLRLQARKKMKLNERNEGFFHYLN